MSDTDRIEVVVRRLLSAPPDVVYDEWLDPHAMADWMCPRPARPTRIELDARVGGHVHIDIDDDGTRMVVTGRYLALDRPHRISFSWTCSTWPSPAHDSVVTVLLEPDADTNTLMTIRHTLLPPDLTDNHERGWILIAGQLEHRLRHLRMR